VLVLTKLEISGVEFLGIRNVFDLWTADSLRELTLYCYLPATSVYPRNIPRAFPSIEALHCSLKVRSLTKPPLNDLWRLAPNLREIGFKIDIVHEWTQGLKLFLDSLAPMVGYIRLVHLQSTAVVFAILTTFKLFKIGEVISTLGKS
jgi:hypothetical protein